MRIGLILIRRFVIDRIHNILYAEEVDILFQFLNSNLISFINKDELVLY